MRVRIDFHGPFRVGTGRARPGAHATVDRLDPLPATSLKGLMRASATLLLPDRADLVDAVFGTPRGPSPWHWSGAEFPDGDRPRDMVRARVSIDPATGAARSGHLLFAEELWAHTATFTVTRTGILAEEDVRTHLTVLACAAAGVHTLGSGRRRGLGWVTCAPEDPAVDDDLIDRFETLRRRDA
ncbi:RAMP superfamily CRISPR-associated protein [Streptomyces alkaliphilus]|uniref:RAMP superfamily CRISPR-associated protein n=1 Tax=Streptomyces alkaliphilus TaxID=1472722 RepID=UPI00117CC510|nr:RAMP superfamily CRISPR-associated protein [Streptomyces alkaliphilus]MQS06742.1 RAMP superfamily protein [Streptomyces alkaliphilus]